MSSSACSCHFGEIFEGCLGGPGCVFVFFIDLKIAVILLGNLAILLPRW